MRGRRRTNPVFLFPTRTRRALSRPRCGVRADAVLGRTRGGLSPRRLPDEQSRDQCDRGGPENRRIPVADILRLPAVRPNVSRAPILAAVLAAPARPQALPNGDGGSRNGCLRRQAAGLLVARLASAHSSRRVRPSTLPNGRGARSSRRVYERLASRAPSAGGRGHSSLPPRQSKGCPPRELSAMRWFTSRLQPRPRAALAPQTGVMQASTAAPLSRRLFAGSSALDPADYSSARSLREDERSTDSLALSRRRHAPGVLPLS